MVEIGGKNSQLLLLQWFLSNSKKILSFFLLLLSLVFLYHEHLFESSQGVTTYAEKKLSSFYGIMIDAGSTGSRVHVYEFDNTDGEYVLLDELFEQIKPGLSSYASDPEAAAQSIGNLLDIAEKRIPEPLWKSTPVALKATAGLRLLEEQQSEAILAAVTAKIESYQFQLTSSGGDESGVSIMSGTDEGVYAWLTINILLTHISSIKTDAVTAGVIDLGGGSMQVCFAPGDATVFDSVDVSEFRHDLSLFGRPSISLYVHSYLGFGLMSAREAVLRMVKSDSEEDATFLSACFPPQFTLDWSNAGSSYHIESSNSIESANWFEECREQTRRAIVDGGHIRRLPSDEAQLRVFFVFSYFFDRALEAGVIGEDGGVVTPGDYERAAEDGSCQGGGEEGDDPFLCLDLCLLSAFLQDGYGFAAEKQLISVKKVSGRETSWTLGAMYSMLQ